MTQHPQDDVTIVGCGIMGLSLAWALAKRGQRVRCLDRSAPGREASAATAGTLSVQNKPLPSIAITLRSLTIWAALSAETNVDVEYEVRGGLRVAHSDDDVAKLRHSVAAQAKAGVPVELLSPKEVAGLAPYLSPDIQAAAYCPLDGMANPFLAVRALVKACRLAGVSFEFHRKVGRIAPAGDLSVRIETDSGAFIAGTTVVATGTWIPSMLPDFRPALPITAKVQQVLITDGAAASVPHIVTHAAGNLTLKQQQLSGKVLIGGGWAGAGNDERNERRLVRDSLTGNARAAIATVPSLASARLLRAWTGFEGRTPDKLPVIGALPDAPAIHVLGCASGGLTIAPAAGELLAQQLIGLDPDLSLAPFSPARFLAHAALAR
jgi:sarcosine oxidase subunit beta